ncbi:hypothetical protein SOVF_210390 [Spinacia oleracea]|nr:hypothetical protein SOVF_210390 [Spinacia oleracea]
MEQHQQAATLPPQSAETTTDVHLNFVANPTPTLPQLAPSHPSYAEMITAAILWDSSQGKAGGSSKRAIAKYIDRVYTNLPPTHSALLTHHLTRLKSSAAAAASPVPLRSAPPPQQFLQPHQQAQLPPEYQSAESTPKRRPGRPAKAKPLAQTTPGSVVPSPATAAGVGNGPSSGKRPRGRPPRQRQQELAVAEVPFVQPVSQPQEQPVYSPPEVGLNNGQTPVRKRGRPFKNQQKQLQQFVQPIYEVEIKPVSANGIIPEVPKRRPGRPSKAQWSPASAPAPGVASVTGAKPRGRGRPKRNSLGPIAMPIGKKPRGRPPRQAAVAPGGGVAGGKRRGRPPTKGIVWTAAPSKLMRKYVGKPRGRPRKNALIVGKETSEQVAANEELMRKVENMQASIKEAVGVLRPYLANEDGADDALTALQQLENLSTMNLTASPTPDEPPMTAASVNATVHVEPSNSVLAPESVTVPTMVAPVVPFSIAAPTITEVAPLYPPPSSASTIETQEPMSWIPTSETQL